MNKKRSFPSTHEVPTIPGTEGWQRMYPYFYTFTTEDKEMQEYENKMLWYYDGLHYPEPIPRPHLDEAWYVGLSQNNSRMFSVPAR